MSDTDYNLGDDLFVKLNQPEVWGRLMIYSALFTQLFKTLRSKGVLEDNEIETILTRVTDIHAERMKMLQELGSSQTENGREAIAQMESEGADFLKSFKEKIFSN